MLSVVHIDETVLQIEQRCALSGPTRGMWLERITSDLGCGVADLLGASGVAVFAKPRMLLHSAMDKLRRSDMGETVEGIDQAFRWLGDDIAGWIFFPRSRQDVEMVLSWMPSYAENGTLTCDASFFAYDTAAASDGGLDVAFPKNAMSVESARAIVERCMLFKMEWNINVWWLTAGRSSVDHILRVQESVVSAINLAVE